MHALFGQSDSQPEGDTLNVSTYYNASQVTDWNNVYAVRVALLTEASSSSASGANDQTYLLLDSKTYKYDDQTLRQIFSTTIALAN